MRYSHPARLAACGSVLLMFLLSCDSGDPAGSGERVGGFSTDAGLYAFITEGDPLTGYTLFPHADSVVAGTLNGSTAHRPMVSVTLNGRASSFLVNGRFPAGESFPDSSVVLKRIIENGTVTLYAVAVKDTGNPLAAGGWLWAEYTPGGSVFYAMTNKGAGCIGCHSLEEGPSHDLIRTFERQLP